MNMVDKQRKAQVKGALLKLAGKGLQKPASGKKASKTNPAVDAVLSNVKEILNIKKEDAQTRLKDLENQEPGTAGANAAIDGMLLGLRVDPTLVDATELENFLIELTDVVEQGKAINKAGKLWRAHQDEQLRSKVEEAMGPPPAKLPSTKKMQKKNLVNKIWLSWNGAWRNKLQHIFKNPDGKFVEEVLVELSLFDESRANDIGVEKAMREFNTAIEQKTGMTARQILKKFQNDMQEDITLPTMSGADGRPMQVTLTRSQMRKRVMEMKNEDLRTLAMDPKTENYTLAIIEAMEAEMANTFDATVMATQLEFYNEYYSRINTVYRRMYGVNLPKVDQYIPIKRDFGDGDGANKDEFLKSILYRGGAIPGSLKSRAPTLQRLKKSGDIETMMSHVTEMEYFIAYAEKVSRLNRVFGGDNNAIMNRITDEFGTAAAATIKADLGYFSNRAVQSSITGEDIIVRLMRNFGFAQLGAKPQIGLKQLASFSAFAQDTNPIDFVDGITEFASNPKAAFALLNKSDFFANRGMNLDIDFKELTQDAVSGKYMNFMGKHPNFTRVMMLPIRYGDKAAIAVGGYAYITAKMKNGMSEEQAIRSFERLANRTQQSADPDQLSEIQRGSGFGRIMAQFMSSANAVTRAEIEAFGEWKKGRIDNKEMMKRFIIYHFMIPNFIMMASNAFTFEGEDQLKASLLGSFTGLILLGDVIEILAATLMQDEDIFDIKGRHPLELGNDLAEVVNLFASGDIAYLDFENAIGALETTLEFGSGLTGIPAATLFNELQGAGKMLSSSTRSDGAKMLLGYSPYIIEKTASGNTGGY